MKSPRGRSATDQIKASEQDEAKLGYCMERYEDCLPHENPNPALVKHFDAGFQELRHVSGSYAGRLLFYPATKKSTDIQKLVMLRIFRKEGQDTPMREIRTAEKRMREDIERRKRQDNQ